jgi:hypothetical protein
MSSMSSSLAMPAPGPGTVRLALIRRGIEVFGKDYTRDELFPVIRAAQIRIRPPKRVAVSTQLIRGYKAGRGKSGAHLDESPIYREFAQSAGLMTIYLKVPEKSTDDLGEVLEAIGYWGQASSFACCTDIGSARPPVGEVARLLKKVDISRSIEQLFSCFVSEFRDERVEWEEVMPVLQPGRKSAIQLDLYIWPMIIRERRSGGKIMQRCSL